jgi:hypothetical protein
MYVGKVQGECDGAEVGDALGGTGSACVCC